MNKKDISKIELLAPAGNLNKLKTALQYGADAVYLGLPDFSLRVRINDFNLKTIKQAVKLAHSQNRKVYITVNIFAHNKHLTKVVAYLKALNKIKVDAFIISDPGIIALVKKYCPKIDIHLSTQANCTNYEAVCFWYKQGVRRIILARELSLKEIKEIKTKCPKMELEYFVHGAMCMSYSGRCFLSKEYTDRSANLGDCVQPCRWQYDVFLRAKGHEDKELALSSDQHGSYIMNSKDLCLIKYIHKLIKAGVTSLKIEGRAKSVYYLANVISIYKRALLFPKEVDFLYQELAEKLTNRGYTEGFLLGSKAEQNIDNSHNLSKWEFCGQVIASKKKANVSVVRVKVHNTIKIRDDIELILAEYNIIKIQVDKIVDFKSKQEIQECHGGGGGQEVILEIQSDLVIPELSVLRRQLK